MIPVLITKADVVMAVRRIDRAGVPPLRKSRNYCLAMNGKHFPPKYTIAVAHEIVTGESLSADRFSGGAEANDFLRRYGFDVVECGCGGGVHQDRGRAPSVHGSPGRQKTAPTRHSERCPECKKRVRELLERNYGSCLSNYRFGWRTDLAFYAQTSIGPTLRDVAAVLQTYRGFSIRDFVRSDTLAGCDFWVPDPGFIVEFDESQHFTSLRKLALSVYADDKPLGFPAKRWITLCEHHKARDNDPPFRDEQRAWYDTLRDLVPPIKGLRSTVRLYARDWAWCSLDPDSREDRDRFSDLMYQGHALSSQTAVATRSQATRQPSTFRVAMVFPQVQQKSKSGVPPSGMGAQRPMVPTISSFAGEPIDFVLFPEGYIRASDDNRKRLLQQLASELDAPLLVGAIEKGAESAGGGNRQVLLRFEPGGCRSYRVYTKHSTAESVAFEMPEWEPHAMLPILELAGIRVGATICHDHYLGLLPRFLAKRGAQLWVNPSFDNVTDVKWSSVLRLRAVENRFFALCTLHCNVNGRETHPFAFAPDGSELLARQAGSNVVRPLSECREAGSIYIIELDMDTVDEPLDWSKLQLAEMPKRVRKGTPLKPVRIALRDGHPSLFGCSGWKTVDEGLRVETCHGPVCVGVIPGERIMDAAQCFSVLDQAKQMNCPPVIWNHWDRPEVDSAKLATLIMGRAIECCAPIVVSDRGRIRELVELANRVKIPVRRMVEPSGEAILDVAYAWGLDNAFKIVAKHLPPKLRQRALDRYRSLR